MKFFQKKNIIKECHQRMPSEVYYCFLPYNIVDVEIKKEKKSESPSNR
jgi:hypothetical protein